MHPHPPPPLAVRRSHGLWLLAVVTGVYETGLAIACAYAGPGLGTGELLVNLAVRSTAFGLVVFLSQRMRDGSDSARWTLAVLFGVAGLVTLVAGPAAWVLDGNTLAILDVSILEWILATSRVVHALAVVVAVSTMFTPAANRWFAGRPAMIGASS